MLHLDVCKKKIVSQSPIGRLVMMCFIIPQHQLSILPIFAEEEGKIEVTTFLVSCKKPKEELGKTMRV